MKSRFLKSLKVLLVEDEEKLSALLKNAIGDSFHSFITAYDGKEGLEKFIEYSPDIVITDIMMPKVTGLEMAKEIKKLNSKIPIIILSAYSETDKLLNAIDIGIIKYFIKPFDPDEVLEYIQSLKETMVEKSILLCDNFSYNITNNTLYKNNRYFSISKSEKLFLQLMFLEQKDNLNNIVKNELIKNTLWNEEVSDERLRTFIRRFRNKTSKELLQNLKGEGYFINILHN